MADAGRNPPPLKKTRLHLLPPQRGQPSKPIRMIRLAITPAAYDAIIATLTDDPSYSVNLCFLEK